MFFGNARLNAFLVALVMIMTIPTVAGIDISAPVRAPSVDANGNGKLGQIDIDTRAWGPEIPVQVPKPGPTERPWWEITSRDSNRNHVVDSLEAIPPGTMEPLIISYSRSVGQNDIENLMELGIVHSYIVENIDSISVGFVDVGVIPDIVELDGVIMVQRAGLPQLYSDVATRAIKARGSTEYSPNSAWEQFPDVTGYGQNIAVVDTGIDDGHPSLEDKRVAGFDAVTPGSRTDGLENPDDRNGHGTSCSGMAAGTSKGDPELAYMGSAPGAGLVDVQIGTDVGAGPFETYFFLHLFYDSALRGLNWVLDNTDTEWQGAEEDHHGIDVMSLSWGITSHEVGGSDGSDPYSLVIDDIVEAGVVCVGAAGNDGPNNDGFSGMSASSGAIIVGATDDINTIDRTDDIIAGYSSRGPRRDDNDGYPYDELKPDVSAPGTNIWNTDPCTSSEGCFGDAEDGGYEARGSGTSYATPAVAGVVALIRHANPELTPDQVKGIIHQTSERRGEASEPDLDPFWNRDFGYGMIDAYEAVKLAIELKDFDLDSIDVELQSHVTDIVEADKGSYHVEGLAWAKIGTVEKVEVSLDGGAWVEAEYLYENGTAETGEFITWRYVVKPSQVKWTGNHTIRVRAVSGSDHSIHDYGTFYSPKGKEDKDEDDLGMVLPGIVTALVLLGILVVVFRKKKD